MTDLDEKLKQLHAEIDSAETAEGDEQTSEILRNIRHSLSEFVEHLEDDADDLREALIERLLETENALKDQHPGLVAGIRSAINILSNSGV